MGNPYVGVFDVESTGVDPETARIVTAFVGMLDGQGNVLSRQGWMVSPDIDIPAGATMDDYAAWCREHNKPTADIDGSWPIRPYREAVPA